MVTALEFDELVGVLDPDRAWRILPDYRLTDERVNTILGMVKKLQKGCKHRYDRAPPENEVLSSVLAAPWRGPLLYCCCRCAAPDC